MKKKAKTEKDLLIEANRRLQETTQELFMAKKELEKKNKELREAGLREHEQRQQLEKELMDLKQFSSEGVKSVSGKTLTKKIAEDISLRYISLLRAYLDTKSLDKEESLVEALCQTLIEYDVTPKGVISIHLKAVPQAGTIGGLETKRVTFEARMVLLAVMTKYADLLRKK